MVINIAKKRTKVTRTKDRADKSYDASPAFPNLWERCDARAPTIAWSAREGGSGKRILVDTTRIQAPP
jgi:hypothetical protein